MNRWSRPEFPTCIFGALSALLVLCAAGLSFGSAPSETMSPQGVSGATSRPLVLSGGTLIDGTGKPSLRDPVIVIRGDRIEAVGRRDQVPIPDGAEVLNTSNQFVLPGLIDSHFHYYDWMGAAGDLFLDFGVTSVFHFGPRIPEVGPASEPLPRWPRVFFSGLPVSTPAEWTLLGKVHEKEIGKITTPEQAREYVRQMSSQGASFIYVLENLTPSLLSAAIQQAHALGLSVQGHAVNTAEAVRAGLDGIEHMTGIALNSITDPRVIDRLAELQKTAPRFAVSHPIANPEYYMEPGQVKKLIRLMVKRHAYVNPTLATRWQRTYPETAEFVREYKAMAESPAWQFVPENFRRGWWSQSLVPYPEWPDAEHKRQEQEGYRKTQEFLRDFTKAGGRILSGTDVSMMTVPGLRLHQELALLVDAGLTPMQAILTATLYPAQFLRREKDLGTVQPGKLADLLVVKADPLQRIENLRRVSHIIVGGKIVPMRFHPDSLNSHPVVMQ